MILLLVEVMLLLVGSQYKRFAYFFPIPLSGIYSAAALFHSTRRSIEC